MHQLEERIFKQEINNKRLENIIDYLIVTVIVLFLFLLALTYLLVRKEVI